MLRIATFTISLILMFGQSMQAQIPDIPEMQLTGSGTALTVDNPDDDPYLIVNVMLSWTERNESWREFPDDVILQAAGKTTLAYEDFVTDYREDANRGFPDHVAFILLNVDDRYVALNFEHVKSGKYRANDQQNRELTKLYQSLPKPQNK